MKLMAIAVSGLGVAAALGGALAAGRPVYINPPAPITQRADDMAASPVALDAVRLADAFDHTLLPAPAPPPPPPPDPAAALRTWRYVGAASSDGRLRALFDRGGAIAALSPGEMLEGRALLRADAMGAVFLVEGAEFTLMLSP
jgi:hypothetical protein